MKISAKSRYALRIMIYLANNYTLDRISVKDISEEEKLSPKYVEHIMSKLIKANLVSATRGIYGGYKLLRPPAKYNVDQIIKAVENYLELTPCTKQNTAICSNYDECISSNIWQLLESTIEELFTNISLLDILHMQEEKTKHPSPYLTHLRNSQNQKTL